MVLLSPYLGRPRDGRAGTTTRDWRKNGLGVRRGNENKPVQRGKGKVRFGIGIRHGRQVWDEKANGKKNEQKVEWMAAMGYVASCVFLRPCRLS